MNKLLKHFEAMQAMSTEYLTTGPYQPQCGLPGEAFTDQELFVRDMVYMLDGPEQREAQAAAVEDIAAMEQASEWRMDIRKQVEQADAIATKAREHACEMEKRNAELQKQVEALQQERSILHADVARFGGMLDMLRELGTIPKPLHVPDYVSPHGGYVDASRRY